MFSRAPRSAATCLLLATSWNSAVSIRSNGEPNVRFLAMLSYIAQGCVAITLLVRQVRDRDVKNKRQRQSFERASKIHMYALRLYSISLFPFVIMNAFVPSSMIVFSRLFLAVASALTLLDAHVRMDKGLVLRLQTISALCCALFVVIGLLSSAAPTQLALRFQLMGGALSYAFAAIVAYECKKDSKARKQYECYSALLASCGTICFTFS